MRSVTPSRTLDPVATRASILDAATRLFADKGFSATSTAEIAAKAGVTKSLVLYHFATKEALWREVIDTKTCAIRELATLLVASDEPIPAAQFIKTKFDALSADPDLARFLAWMSLEPNLSTPVMREKAHKVREKMEADPSLYGLPPGVDPLGFVVLMMSAVDGYFRFRSFYSAMVGCDLLSTEAEVAFFDVLMRVGFAQRRTDGV